MSKNPVVRSDVSVDPFPVRVADPTIGELIEDGLPLDTTIDLAATNQATIALDVTLLDQVFVQLDTNSEVLSDSESSNTLEVTDSISDDVLFELGQVEINSAEIGASGAASQYTLRSSSYDPIDYGDPMTDAAYWRHQAGMASCAVVAQISVYESLTGYRISETDACNYAQSQGWFDPQNGTPLAYTGNILNVLGIATYGGTNSTINQLADALARGDKPIVGLDANEIWNPQRDHYGRPVEQQNAGHAVWVTGIDVKPNGSATIILNDSGTSWGKAEVVNYTDFYHAWQDYGFFAAIADNPFT